MTTHRVKGAEFGKLRSPIAKVRLKTSLGVVGALPPDQYIGKDLVAHGVNFDGTKVSFSKEGNDAPDAFAPISSFHDYEDLLILMNVV